MQQAKRLAIMLAVCAAVARPGWAQQVQVSPANRTISVTVTEDAQRRADVATLSVGYRIYGPDADSTYAEAARRSAAIAAALEAAGISKDLLSSESQTLAPSTEFENSKLSPAERAAHSFLAEQSWSVKTTPDAAARVLAAAVGAGANNSGQIGWALADEASLTAEAGVKALGHAHEMAQGMAKGLGARVGNLLYATNQVEASRPLTFHARVSAPAPVVKAAPPSLSLSAPMITRSATVSAIFALE